MSFVSSSDIISVVVPVLNIFFYVFLHLLLMLLQLILQELKCFWLNHINGLITFFIIGNPVFSNGPRSLPRKPSDCIILVFQFLIT